MVHIDWFKGVLFPYINFFIFIFLAVKLFKKTLNDFAKSRKENFLKLVEESNNIFQKMSQENKELTQRLTHIDKELTQLHETALKRASAQVEQLNEKTKSLIDNFKKEQQQKIQTEIQNYVQKLKSEIIKESIDIVAAKITKEKQEDILHKNLKILDTINLQLGK